MNKRAMVTDRERESMETVYVQGLRFLDGVLGSHDPLEVAAVLSSLALSLYRTVLSDDDFEEMVDMISDSRGEIKPFRPPGGVQ